MRKVVLTICQPLSIQRDLIVSQHPTSDLFVRNLQTWIIIVGRCTIVLPIMRGLVISKHQTSCKQVTLTTTSLKDCVKTSQQTSWKRLDCKNTFKYPQVSQSAVQVEFCQCQYSNWSSEVNNKESAIITHKLKSLTNGLIKFMIVWKNVVKS